MFTTLSPCPMCAGTIILYGLARVVIGDNSTYKGDEQYLTQNGIEVVHLNDSECTKLMKEFVTKRPDIWFEDSAGHTRCLFLGTFYQ